MKTTTFQDVLNQAAENAGRTRDKISIKEQTMLKGFLTTEFPILLNSQQWPELIPDFFQVQNIANNQFSKNEGSIDPAAPEMGDILAILNLNPHTTEFWEPIPASEGDGVVYLHEGRTTVWVEYMLPYPGVRFPDLGALALAAFFAATLPLKFRAILAHKAAAHLLASDSQTAVAGVQFGLSKTALDAEVMRLPAPPDWRGLKATTGRHRRFGTPTCTS